MTLIRRAAALSTSSSLSEAGQFIGVLSVPTPGDDDFMIPAKAIDMSRLAAGNMPLLLQHDPDKIVGQVARHWVDDAGRLMIVGQFPPLGTSSLIDDTRRSVAAGTLRGLSMGFSVDETRPVTVDGRRVTEVISCLAMEASLVALPMLADTLITERSHRYRNEHRRPLTSAQIRTAARYLAELALDAKSDRSRHRLVHDARRLYRRADLLAR